MILNSLTIDGTERIDKVRMLETEITHDLGGRVATARFVLDQGAEGAVVGRAIVGQSVVGFAPPRANADIIATTPPTERVFAGFLSKLSMAIVDGVHRYDLDCIDYTVLMDAAMIESEAYASQTDEAILDDLFATYLPSVSTADVVSVETLDSLEFSDVSLREGIERIQERTGAIFFLDFNKRLQYYAEGSEVAPFDIDEHDAVYYPLADSLKYEVDSNNLANRVHVIGIGAETESTVVTYNPGVSADDGFANQSGPTYPPAAGSTSGTGLALDSCGRSFGAGVYVVQVALLRFDTSPIPNGATIISAMLKFYVDSTTSANSGELQGEYYNPAAWPIDTTDYTNTPSETAFDGLPTFAFVAGQYNNVTLKDVDANISKTGYTAFRLHVAVTGTPTGANTFVYQSFDGANKPVLEVVYQTTTAGAEATENNTASQALYGVLERTIIDRNILTSAEASLRAQVELATYATPRVSGTLKIREDGLAIGQLVTVALPSLGVSDDFIIRRLVMRWITDDLTEYTVDFGDFRPDLITLVRKMSRQR